MGDSATSDHRGPAAPFLLEAGQARPASPLEAGRAARPGGPISLRAVLLGLALIPPTILWLHQLEIVWYSSQPTTISLYFHVIFVLLALIAANAALHRLRPAWALRPAELALIYVMLAIASSLAGHDQMEILIPILGESTWFATEENHWRRLFDQYLPDWLVVKDARALAPFYEGGSTLYTRDHLLAWARPAALWTAFILSLFTVTLCINLILRKQWTERERLTYPIAQVPLDITHPRFALWRSRLFWLGLLPALLIDTLNGFAYLYPSLPSIPTRVQWLDFSSWPWTATGGFTVSFYPFAIGLGYLLPLDLLFSSWLFYWFWKGQYLLSALLGYGSRPNFPYVVEQSCGGYLGLCLFAIYLARRHLAAVARRAITGDPAVDDTTEPVSYRLAFAGFVLGCAALLAFAAAVGVSIPLALLFFGMYLALSTAVTRMRAELGPPAHDLHYGGPDSILPRIAGPAAFGGPALAFFSLTWWMNRAFRSQPMPHQIEGLYIASRRDMSGRRMLAVMLLTALAAVVVSFWSLTWAGYHYGWSAKMGIAARVFGREPFDRLASWLAAPTHGDTGAAVALGLGVAFSLALLALRTTFIWWPLHPVGYAVSSSWSMNLLWMPMLIAWAIKFFVLHFGGLRLYRRGLPLFLGLIIGEYVAGGIWSLLGVALQKPMWVFWPY